MFAVVTALLAAGRGEPGGGAALESRGGGAEGAPPWAFLGCEDSGGAGRAAWAGGWPAAAHKEIEILLAQRKGGRNYEAPYFVAALYADTGDKEHAFEWLDIAYQEHVTYLIFLRTDPAFDSLHSDPRFAELARKVGFPQ